MRRRYTAEERQQFVEQVRSGATVREVAARLGLNSSLGYRWMQLAGAASSSKGPRFARLVRASAASVGAITLQVGPVMIRVEAGFDSELLRAVVSALSAGSR